MEWDTNGIIKLAEAIYQRTCRRDGADGGKYRNRCLVCWPVTDEEDEQ